MTAKEELAGFIRSTFRSVWSLELLVHLSDTRDRSWSQEQLVSELRASELIVSQSLDALIAAGLVSIDQNGCARFSPASDDLERLSDGAKALYARSPDAVRRLIISTTTGGISAFADAFRLRKD
jgi:hypothetical protein